MLTQSLQCFMNFIDHNCVIHDVKSHRMIGLGELIAGLYGLKVHSSSPCLAFPAPSNNTATHLCNFTNVQSDSIIPVLSL